MFTTLKDKNNPVNFRSARTLRRKRSDSKLKAWPGMLVITSNLGRMLLNRLDIDPIIA